MNKKNILTAFLFSGCLLNQWMAYSQDGGGEILDRKWWKEAVVYQVYPRSFKDSDGDGIGDLKGILSRLDYIKSLGVDVIWLNPIYSSPNDDNGYDVSNYRDIMKDFGTMADFDALLKAIHEKGLKLVMDFVFNHSSDEHEWFQQSRSSRTNTYRNYYHWWNAENGKPPYRYSLFDINHDAWKYDSLTNAYYLHYFSRKQPDLNWENPKLRHELYEILKFWADKGIDGYRLDAFQFAAKDTTFPAFPIGFEKDFSLYYALQGNLHGYLQEMHQEVFAKYNGMSVAEGAGHSFEDAHNLVDANRKELDMAYAFDGVDVAKPDGYSLLHFKEVFTRWDSAFARSGWLAIFLANHDQARLVSRFGNDKPPFRAASAKMLATFLMTMRGTPFYYNGDELGMTNAGFTKIEEYRDMPTLNEYQHLKATGGNFPAFMKEIQFSCRDNGRTPFQWDTSLNAGFTTGNPWIQINKNYRTVNAAEEEKDTASVLNYFRKIVRLRKDNKVLVYGQYELLDKGNPDVYVYVRELEGKKILIALNFRDRPSTFSVKFNLSKAERLICNYGASGSSNVLRPYEAVVYALR